jgi:3-oxoacyl-[acyl-carrier protein] reductase
MDLQLKDKVALVTGSSRGLGYATAHLLAQEGAKVAINSRTSNELAAAARRIADETGCEVAAFAGDVTRSEVPNQLIEQVISRFGCLDILIANAGGPPPGSFESFNDQDWQHAIDLSFMSHVRLIRAALPYLKQSPAASVLTVTSYAVKQPIPNLVLSNSIRAATIGLTKTLALELGPVGIRFNSILPAWTNTDRVQKLMQARAQANGTTVEEESRKPAIDSPLGRMAEPEEFARAAVFLVSPAASYITGVMLPVDGGMYKGTF